MCVKFSTQKEMECVCVCSVVSDSAVPWTIAHVPLSMGFPRQEYWSRLPFASPLDLSNSGIEPAFLCLLHWQADSLPLCQLGSLCSGIEETKHSCWNPTKHWKFCHVKTLCLSVFINNACSGNVQFLGNNYCQASSWSIKNIIIEGHYREIKVN